MAANGAGPGRPALQLSEYLEKLPGTTFRRLYQQPSAAFAIFRRMLSPLARTFVMKMLYMPTPLPLSVLDVMVKPEAKRLKDQALSMLKSLHMVQITPPSKDRPQEIRLTTNFGDSFRLALEGGGSHNSFGVQSTLPIPPEIDIAYLDRYARRKREDILHYVVNSVDPGSSAPSSSYHGGGANSGDGPKASVKDLLLAGRLVERRPDVRGIGITQAGFTFLLQEPNAQVWTLLLLWLEVMEGSAANSSRSALDPVDMLAFLFMLATTELGRPYDTTALTEQRKNMLPFLVDFGLVYVPQHKPQQYYPTRLATTLTSSASSLRSVSAGVAAATNAALGNHSSADASTSTLTDQQVKGSVILETNFRIYAYTSSPLQIAVLSLFAQLKMRFPDMVTGRLSRQSIRRAISFGITAEQVISYMQAHAHEQMHRHAATANKPVLPPTVIDQIRLWQLENERMKTTTGFLFKDFDTFKEYMAVANYADEVGVLVWRGDSAGMFFASKHEQIRDFMKLRKKAD